MHSAFQETLPLQDCISLYPFPMYQALPDRLGTMDTPSPYTSRCLGDP